MEEIIDLANNNISNDLIASKKFVTNNTLDAENKTSKLSGIDIDTSILQEKQI